MIFRVSEVESYRQWLEDEEAELEPLLARLRGEIPPSPDMEAGTAFHKALELSKPGEFEQIEGNGYTFLFPQEAQIELPNVREIRASKQYGGITITGCVDVLDGLRIEDHKTTGRFDPDRYLAGVQWRYYLDIFGAYIFRWNVYEIEQLRERVYSVKPPQFLTQYRYPRLHADCEALALSLEQFARKHMPERITQQAA